MNAAILKRDFAPSDPSGDPIAVSELQRLADYAASKDLRIAAYPHIKDWTERTADALRLVKASDHPSLGIEFNLCHALMSGDEKQIDDLLTEAGPKLFSVTLNGADSVPN